MAVDAPVNHFPLHGDDRPAVLIAGGIGITPIKAMAHALKARGVPFSLHYAARTPADMASRHHLADRFASESHFYFAAKTASSRCLSSPMGHNRRSVSSAWPSASSSAGAKSGTK